MTSQQPQLDYAPPLPWRRRPIARWLIIAGAVLVLLPLGFRTGRAAYERMRINALVRTCLAHTPATVVFTENDPNAAQVPAAWTQLAQRFGESLVSRGTLFLHERTTPDGRQVLVGVDLAEIRRGQPLVASFVVRVIEPAATLKIPRAITFDVLPEILDEHDGIVRMMGGQIDPQDPTHFTIRYTVSDRPGIIDGWVLRDGSVKLESRAAR